MAVAEEEQPELRLRAELDVPRELQALLTPQRVLELLQEGNQRFFSGQLTLDL